MCTWACIIYHIYTLNHNCLCVCVCVHWSTIFSPCFGRPQKDLVALATSAASATSSCPVSSSSMSNPSNTCSMTLSSGLGLGSHLPSGWGFPSGWGYPHSWMVYFMENAIYKWMITSGTPISGNPHMCKFTVFCSLFIIPKWATGHGYVDLPGVCGFVP